MTNKNASTHVASTEEEPAAANSDVVVVEPAIQLDTGLHEFLLSPQQELCLCTARTSTRFELRPASSLAPTLKSCRATN